MTLAKTHLAFRLRIFVTHNNVFPKDQRHLGEVHANVKRLHQAYGVHIGAIREIRKIDESSR